MCPLTWQKLQFLTQISWEVLPGIIFRAGISLHVGQCKIPSESTKPLLVEQSRGNGFTFRTPVHTLVFTQSRCLEIVTRRKRVKTLPLGRLCLKLGIVYNAVQVSKWIYNVRIFRQTSRSISYMNLEKFFVLFTSNTLKTPILVFIANSDELHTEVSFFEVNSCIFIQNLLPFYE